MPRTAGADRIGRGWRGAIAVLRVWRHRLRERGELARLDERALRDFGASRGDVAEELRKPFWRA